MEGKLLLVHFWEPKPIEFLVFHLFLDNIRVSMHDWFWFWFMGAMASHRKLDSYWKLGVALLHTAVFVELRLLDLPFVKSRKSSVTGGTCQK